MALVAFNLRSSMGTGNYVYILDAASGTTYLREAVSGAFLPDGRRFIYGRSHPIGCDGWGSSCPEDSPDKTARKVGVHVKEVADASYTGVHLTEVVQPILLDLATGQETPLPMVGGGTLCRSGDQILGLDTPLLWLVEDQDQRHVKRLDLERKAWLPIPPAQRMQALSAWRSCLVTVVGEKDQPPGSWLALTLDGSLGIGVVKPGELQLVLIDVLSDPQTLDETCRLPAAREIILDARTPPHLAAVRTKACTQHLDRAHQRLLAVAANTRGYRLLEDGRGEAALPLFALASEIDATYGMPRVNAARVLAKLWLFDLARSYLADVQRMGRPQCQRLLAAKSDPAFATAIKHPGFSEVFTSPECEEPP